MSNRSSSLFSCVLVLASLLGMWSCGGNGSGSSASARCGDSIVEAQEDCDDGGVDDGDGCSSECSREDAEGRDFASGLLEFRFAQRPGLGFCPEDRSIVQAEFVVSEGGRAGFKAAIVEEVATDPAIECLPNVLGERCLVVRESSDVLLTRDQARKVMHAFQEVNVGTVPGEGCGRKDPCVVRWYQWRQSTDEGVRVSELFDGECAPQILPSAIHEIDAVLRDVLAAQAGDGE